MKKGDNQIIEGKDKKDYLILNSKIKLNDKFHKIQYRVRLAQQHSFRTRNGKRVKELRADRNFQPDYRFWADRCFKLDRRFADRHFSRFQERR